MVKTEIAHTVNRTLAELSMGNLVGSKTPSELSDVASRLTEIEVLYAVASKPLSAQDLVDRLETTFGLETDIVSIGVVLAGLVDSGFIRRFSSSGYPNPSSRESFSIAPTGITKLSRWIESLSEITLTMQLGLHQRIAIAEE
jgi:hypothetical protein